MQIVKVSEDFYEFPAGRFKSHGKGSGEEFRDKFLEPAIVQRQKITVVLDGVTGYPPSFLEEAFGGLIRKGYTKPELIKYIEISAGDDFKVYKILIDGYIDKASRAR